MKANELMIGDWVLHDSKPKTVDVIWGKAVSLNDPTQVWGSIYADKFNENDIEPILLTDEILEQNGFERVNGEYQDVFYMCDGIELLIDNVYTLFGQYKMPIKYVHELQHAIRLCGINKEIEI